MWKYLKRDLFSRIHSKVKVFVAQLGPILCNPKNCNLCPWNYLGKNARVGSQPLPSPRNLPDLGIEPKSLALQADSLPSELSGNLL